MVPHNTIVKFNQGFSSNSDYKGNQQLDQVWWSTSTNKAEW